VAGGGTTALDAVEEYDPITDAWTSRAAMPTARSRLLGAVVGGKLYAIGGYNAGYLTVVEAYDPLTDSWSTRAPLPAARVTDGTNATVVNDRIYVVGGETPSYQAEVFEYNPASNSWIQCTDVPTPGVRGFTAALNGRIHAVGAHQGTGAYAAVNEVGTLSTLVGSVTAEPSAASVGQTVTVRLGFTNGSPDTVSSINPSLQIGTGGGLVSGLSGPTPAGPLSLAAGASASFTWTFNVSGAGSIVLSASATGTGGCGQALVACGTATVRGIGVAPPGTTTGTTPSETQGIEVGAGKVLAAPNVLETSDPASVIKIAVRGDPNAGVVVRIYSESGEIVRKLTAVTGGSGGAVVTFDGRDEKGVRLGSGVYWAVASGGGVNDRKAIFMVKRRKK
jgi:hypothetical protein